MGADRVARWYAILRGVMLLAFSAMFILQPEQMMAGSSAEPARSLALVFTSRSIVLAIAFIALAAKRKREALGWVLYADALLQVFDTSLSVATGKGILSLVPAVLGVLDVWAGRVLLRTAKATS